MEEKRGRVEEIGLGFLFLMLFLLPSGGGGATEVRPYAQVQPVPLSRVQITGGFWAEKQELILHHTLPAEWEQLEKNHHVDNFRVAAGIKPGVHQGLVFFDSDLYKWVEAASYFLARRPEDPWLKARVEELIGLFQAAQRPDGYLNTYYQSFALDQRLSILLLNHELYCAGHLIEAACAHHASTSEDRLLRVGQNFANFLSREFGPGRREGFDGHEEIELALIRLYRETGEKKYLDLAAFFIHQRGRQKNFAGELLTDLREEASLAKIAAEKRRAFLPPEEKKPAFGFSVGNPINILRSTAAFLSGRYFQADKPIEEYTVAEGHAVRAMYYFTGAGDLFLETGDQRLLSALLTTWENTTARRTYLTGGMGSVALTEGFGRDYELPNRSYAETCAAAGAIFWNWRLLLATGQARFADQLERTLYNGFLSGLSLDGKHFFYQNPLASFGQDTRKEWFTVACCPPNLARVIASLGQYLYGESQDGVWVHQYVTSEAHFSRPEGEVTILVESGLPWEGKVKLQVQPAKPMTFTLHLRVPGWSEQTWLTLNGEPLEVQSSGGAYLALQLEWRERDILEISFDMKPRLVSSPPQVRENRNKVAILRGPLVYALEDKDNPGVNVHTAVLAKAPELRAELRPDLLGGIVVITGKLKTGEQFTAIPYYAWQNRGPSHMEVWLQQEK